MTNEPLSEDELLNDENADVVYSFIAPAGLEPGQSGLVFAACVSGLKRSTDGGQTWEDALVNMNLSEPLPITALAIDPDFAHTGRVFAGTSGGLFISSDTPAGAAIGGQAWRAVLLPQPPPTVSTLAISPVFERDSIIFAGTMEDGVFTSQNGGEKWVAWNFGMLDLNVMCLAISPDFSTDETLFAGCETGIFRSSNGGRAWREIEPPFGYEAVISLALSPRYASDHTLYAGTESQGLWLSRDEGDTWTRLDEAQIIDPVNAILVAQDGLLVATSAALWRSLDGGLSWANCLPASYTDREVSALLAPHGFGPGAKVLVGFTGGEVESVSLG